MKKVKELASLNSAPSQEIISADFTIEELEQRLETDPLFLGNLFNLTDDAAERCTCNRHCECKSFCEHSCGCDGINICSGNLSCPDKV